MSCQKSTEQLPMLKVLMRYPSMKLEAIKFIVLLRMLAGMRLCLNMKFVATKDIER